MFHSIDDYNFPIKDKELLKFLRKCKLKLTKNGACDFCVELLYNDFFQVLKSNTIHIGNNGYIREEK